MNHKLVIFYLAILCLIIVILTFNYIGLWLALIFGTFSVTIIWATIKFNFTETDR
jgi:predicted membrane protein